MNAAPAPSPFLDAALPRLPLDEWAPRYRIVTEGAHVGRWSPRRGLFAIEPMRAVSSDDVRRVILVAPTQLVKSDFVVTAALYFAYYGDSSLFVEPDKDLVSSFFRERIRPGAMALGTVHTAGMEGEFVKKRDSAMEVRISGAGGITGVTPGMRAGLAARSVPVVIFDELDLMGRADLMTQAESRVTTFGLDGRIIAGSTPTDAEGTHTIWHAWLRGSRGVWRGRCVACAGLMSMDWDVAVRFEKEDDGYWKPETARVVCEHCAHPHSEPERLTAAKSGCYVHDDPTHRYRTFRVPGPAHILRSLSTIAELGAAEVEAWIERGEWEGYRVWTNQMAALPWRDEIRGLSARRLSATTFSLGARGTGDMGELDRRALIVTGATDVGGHGMYTELVAWGVDIPRKEVLSWGLHYRVTGGTPDDSIEDADLWRAYEKLLGEARWRHPDFPGQTIRPARVFIDCNWQTELVRSWCNARMESDARASGVRYVGPYGAWILPSRGKTQDIRGEAIDLRSGLQRPKGKAYILPAVVNIQVNAVKDMVWGSFMRDGRRPEGAARCNLFPTNAAANGYGDAWFREFANERRSVERTRKGTVTVQWQTVHGQGRKNEAWDCRIYATAAVLFLGYPLGLKDFLFRLALRHATRQGSTTPPGEVAELRRIVGEQEGIDS